jgi:hypothetical protein
MVADQHQDKLADLTVMVAAVDILAKVVAPAEILKTGLVAAERVDTPLEAVIATKTAPASEEELLQEEELIVLHMVQVLEEALVYRDKDHQVMDGLHHRRQLERTKAVAATGDQAAQGECTEKILGPVQEKAQITFRAEHTVAEVAAQEQVGRRVLVTAVQAELELFGELEVGHHHHPHR